MHGFIRSHVLPCSLLLLAVVHFSCKDGDPKGSRPGMSLLETNYQSKLAQVRCYEQFKCLEDLPGRKASEAICRARMLIAGIVDGEEYLHVILSGGTFDAGAFERCMQRRLERQCSKPRTYDADCDTYLTGVRGIGEPCRLSSECTTGYCPHFDFCSCAPRKAAGETCIIDRECVAGLVCSRATGKCMEEERFPGPGEACHKDVACLDGTTCSTLDGSGTCIPLPVEGEPCAGTVYCSNWSGCSAYYNCASGLICHHGQICRQPQFGTEPGDYCQGSLNPCEPLNFLQCFTAKMYPQKENTCVRSHQAGERVTMGTGGCHINNTHLCCWHDAYLEDGFCRPRKRLGEQCNSFKECHSNSCSTVPDKPHKVCTLNGGCSDDDVIG